MKKFDIHSKLHLAAGIALILVGCASNPPQLQTSETDEAASPIAEEFSSITAARENAIADSEQLVLLEETLESANVLDDEENKITNEDVADDQIAETTPFESDIEAGVTSEIEAEITAVTPEIEIEADTEAEAIVEADAETGVETIAEIETATKAEEKAEEIIVKADIWTRIRNGFTLPDKGHIRVNGDKNWYSRHQDYLDRTFERADPYLFHIVEEIEARGMPMEIALLPVVESAFQPFAYSHGRASGIWQFIPGTGRRYGLKINWWYDGRRDIKAATTAALDYLQHLNKRFDGDWLLALAAYNSGEGTVSKAIRKNKKRGKGTTFWDLSLPKETRGYVPKLLAIASVVAHPEEYNVTLKEIPNQPVIDEVDIGSQLDLAVAADMAGLSLEKLYTYNPAYNRWATAPGGPHQLLLPIEKIEPFKEKLAELPAEKRVKWVRHRIKNGQTLGHIADKYRTTVGTIKKVNKIRGHMIRAGKHLLIPVASKSATDYALSAEQRLRNKQRTPKGGKKIIYTVRPGDNFWDISRAYKVSHRKLASWNGMAPRDILRPGQKLVIWSKSKAPAVVTARVGSSPRATQKINYRVRNGDSLARISQKFNISVAQLKRWNPNTTKGKYIQPGQRLVLYVDVTKVAEAS